MHLINATDEQKRSRDLLTHGAWGQRISVEAYCRRELRLRAHPWCRGRMQTWLWVDAGGDVLASCETFRMRSIFHGEESSSFGIASVFTEERLRGRGHALAMMRALGQELRRRDPDAHGVLLFSEVGATLYERAGYQPRFCQDRVFPAQAAALPIHGQFFGEGEAAALLERFRLPAQEYLVWPTAAQIDWQLERARIYAGALGRVTPASCGIEIGEARALWAADFKNERLAVLLASAPDAHAARALVAAAQQAAHDEGLAEVRIWETPSLPLPPDVGAALSRDHDALPMILPFAAGLQADAWGDIPRALWI